MLVGLVVSGLNMGGASGASDFIKVNGRKYDFSTVSREGIGGMQLVQALGGQDNMAFSYFLAAMCGTEYSSEEAMQKNFFVGRILLKQAKEDFGIHPSEEDISNFIKKLSAFTSPDGSFNQESYRNVIEKGIGRWGLTENDLRNVVSDVLACQKLQTLMQASMRVDSEFPLQVTALNNQQITAQVVQLELAPLAEKIKPTEEEVKAHWETSRDNFVTDPKRKFTYVIAGTPADKDKSVGNNDKPAENKDDAASDKAKDNAAKAAETARKKQMEFDTKVSEFADELAAQNGNDFEQLVKKYGWETKTTELFPATEPPADLKIPVRSNVDGTIIGPLFRISVTADSMSKFSSPLPVGENQWLIARLDSEEISRTKTFEEAKDDARKQYISEKANDSLKAAIDAAATKIRAALAAKKSFADAAKEADLPPIKTIPQITKFYRSEENAEPREFFKILSLVTPGTIAEPVVETGRAFIAYVEKREVVKTPLTAEILAAQLSDRAQQNGVLTLQAWIANRRTAANVEMLQPQS